ncbi:hypothetical protein GGS20DRAFT_582132 [Poronia punctata]|nr:hypothetical protein GGS20DRAFT_582132 [Poronia punctata]
MATHHLSQLASQVPRFIDEHEHRSKRRRDPTTLDICAQYFDFPAFYGEDEPSSPGTRSRSVASSDPGLTSGSSEEDGAPSPGPQFDTYHSKDIIKQAKQHDDRFTVPEREIRPKALAYPSKIHLDNAPSPTGSGTSGSNVVILSTPSSPTLLDAALEENHPLHRGRRTRPLENPEKVAVMRKLGACYRCNLRKVPCDEGAPCSNCTDYAVKIHHGDCEALAEQMCFRHQPALIFREIHHSINAEYAPRPTTANAANMATACTLNIFFQPLHPRSIPLSLEVLRTEHEQCAGLPNFHGIDIGARGPRYTLSNRESSGLWDKIVDWASSQMGLDGSGSFQSALDRLVIACLPGLPHSDLLRDVHRLRCYYKVLRQKRFTCQAQPGRELDELPSDFHRFLRASLSRAIADVEEKVWLGLMNRKRKPSQDKLSIWACCMQIILLYRDVTGTNDSEESWFNGNTRRKAESLMNCAAVMHEVQFGKKKVPVPRDDINIALLFDNVESRQTEFFAQVRQHDRPLDGVLGVLLAKPQKNTTRSRMPPPQKKQRKSA